MKQIKIMPYKTIAQCFTAVAFTLLTACTGMDHTYEEFLDDSDKLYPGKVDSVLISTGYKQIRINVLLSSDPKVNNLKLYWNNRRDSMEVAILPEEAGQRKDLTIKNINEGMHSFEMYTFDANKNRSVVTEAFGKVYGEEFRSEMSNRYIASCATTKENEVQINWEKADITYRSVTTEVRYEDNNGKIQNVAVNGDESVTNLPAYKAGRPLEYRTLIVPDSSCMDTLATDFVVTRVRAEYNKSAWKVTPSSQDNATPRPATNVIDNDLNTMWHTDSKNGAVYPHTLTLDMGKQQDIEAFLFLQRPNYANPVKEFELLTNNTGNDSETWKSLGSFTLSKSTQYQSVKLPKKEKLRYVKMVFKSDWGGSSNLALMEVGAFVEW